MTTPDRQAGYDLLEQMLGLEFEVVSEETAEGTDLGSTIIVLKIPEEDVETSVLGLLFALTVLSFRDATPAGLSVNDYQAQDEWTVRDFLRGLSFRRGQLHFYADYVHGRRMKTDITVEPDGKIQVRAIGRGAQPRGWVDILRGKDRLSLLDEGKLGPVQ